MLSSAEKDHSNSRVTANETLENEKIKLRRDIKELKALNFQVECCLNISKFGNIEHLLKSSEPASVGFSSKKNIPDVDTEYMDEFFQLAGLHCTKFTENEYIFRFISSGNIESKECNYAIQIKSESDKLKLGKWNMPMSIDMTSLLLETPLRNTTDLKPFMANCKHHIDCYANRVRQYNELQPILKELSGCNSDSNLGHTIITLKLSDMQIVESETSYNVVVYLIYDSKSVRPHEIKIDSSNEATLSDDVVSTFRSHFKLFKRFELKNAFEETCEATDGPIKWMREQTADNLNLDDSSVSDSEGELRPKRRKSLRRGLKRKIKETSFHSPSSPNREQRLEGSDLEEANVSTVADTPALGLVNSMDEERANSPKTRVEHRPTKKKKKEVKRTEASVVPEVEEKSKATKSRKTSLKSSQNKFRRTLRQSTLKVQFEKTKETQRPESDAGTSKDVHQIPSTDGSIVRREFESNINVSKNIEFGTSTPVHNLNLKQKRFVSDDSREMSPIRPKHNMISKWKLHNKEPG